MVEVVRMARAFGGISKMAKIKVCPTCMVAYLKWITPRIEGKFEEGQGKLIEWDLPEIATTFDFYITEQDEKTQNYYHITNFPMATMTHPPKEWPNDNCLCVMKKQVVKLRDHAGINRFYFSLNASYEVKEEKEVKTR